MLPLPQATLAGCKDVCNAPLPHVYEETAAASGGAAKAIETIGGPGFSAEQISRVRTIPAAANPVCPLAARKASPPA